MTEKTERILAVDVFRGLTILMMIFVNDLASIKDIPFWMKHMPTEVDGMTFVDLVFPAFLFIVGMSIPLALKKRLSVGDKPLKIWLHILIRTVGLLVLGLFMVNTGSLNEELTGISKHTYLLSFCIAVILLWNQYPKSSGNKKILNNILRAAGVVILFVLAFIYRSGTVENIGWFHTYWWGILGLIGWAYLLASIIYYIFKTNITALIGAFVLLILLYIGDKFNLLGIFQSLSKTLWIGGHIGGHTAITLAGVIVSIVIMTNVVSEKRNKKIIWVLSFSAFIIAAGYFIRPLYGISKNLSTPTFALYSSAICSVLFCFLYWITDIMQIRKWTFFVLPAGSNPLLAYILPDIFYSIIGLMGITFLSDNFGSGVWGIIRSLVFAFVMVYITSIFSKYKIRLHL
ncbi:MAG: DUF5009 domain-containing protein [bacterium]